MTKETKNPPSHIDAPHRLTEDKRTRLNAVRTEIVKKSRIEVRDIVEYARALLEIDGKIEKRDDGSTVTKTKIKPLENLSSEITEHVLSPGQNDRSYTSTLVVSVEENTRQNLRNSRYTMLLVGERVVGVQWWPSIWHHIGTTLGPGYDVDDSTPPDFLPELKENVASSSAVEDIRKIDDMYNMSKKIEER